MGAHWNCLHAKIRTATPIAGTSALRTQSVEEMYVGAINIHVNADGTVGQGYNIQVSVDEIRVEYDGRLLLVLPTEKAVVKKVAHP